MRISGTSASILWRIGKTKKAEIANLSPRLSEFKLRAFSMPPAIDLMGAMAKPAGLSIIAEIKKASPSAGVIAEDFDPALMARAYREAKADAVSVLTDCDYFKGSVDYLSVAKAELGSIPVLRKDFILDALQVYEARAYGADSFLLIAAMLEGHALEDLIGLGRSLGMEPLVESHDLEDLERSVAAGARLLGFNNRNLNDFSVDISVSGRLAAAMPKASVAIAESGIKTPEDAAILFKAGCKGILVGETLMRDGPSGAGARMASFREACRT